MKFPNNVSSCPQFPFFSCRTLRPALVLILLAVALPAFARPHVGVRHHYLVQVARDARPSVRLERGRPKSAQTSGYHTSGVVTVSTAAGPITVASDAADKFVSLTNDLVAHGFHGSVTCLASGHMPGSLHHTGHACDFAQTARNRTAAVMYHVGDIIAAHGLRDGCSFGDCGHVDTGMPLEGRRFAASASRHRTERVAYQDHGSSQFGAGSWGGTNGMTAATFAPHRASRVRVAARETGRAVVMGFSDRGPVADERFLEVNGGAAYTYGLVRHGHVRRWIEPK